MADRPCTHWIGAENRRCGATDTHHYLPGDRCGAHTPAAIAGVAEPPPGVCAPARCYCGDPDCPAYATYELRDRYAVAIDSWAATDARAIASGKRRASPQQVAAARATVAEQRDRETRLRRSA